MMTAKSGYLIDMDGVIYRGGQLIPGADTFVNRLIEQGIPFTFLTNNSQRSRRDVAAKLRQMGIQAEPGHVYTCADATAGYLARQKPHGTAFVIGEGGLLTALHDHGFAIVDKQPDYVVIGECRTYNAESVEQALNLILRGAKFVATNLDPNCPTQSGTRPGCGALVAMLEQASGIKAFSVGKPSPVMMRGARKTLGLRAGQTVMIGDTMDTDILGATQLGYYSVLVLTGVTNRQDLGRFAYQPDEVVASIEELDHEALAAKLAARDPDVAFDSEFISVGEPAGDRG